VADQHRRPARALARPTSADIFSSSHVDYEFGSTSSASSSSWPCSGSPRRGATDPVCGMKVDGDKAVTKVFDGETYYFCSTHCLHAFEANPDVYRRGIASEGHGHTAMPTTEPIPKESQ
jgi:YHS domain-containing protein